MELVHRHLHRVLGRVLRDGARVREEDELQLLEERVQDVVHLLLPQRPQVHVHDLHALPAREPLLEVLLRLALERLRLLLGVVALGVDVRRADDHLVGRRLGHELLVCRIALGAALGQQVLDEALDGLGGRHLLDRAVLVDAAAREALEELVKVEHLHRADARRLRGAELLGRLRVHEGHLDLRHREAPLVLRLARGVARDVRLAVALPDADEVLLVADAHPLLELQLVDLIDLVGRARLLGVVGARLGVPAP